MNKFIEPLMFALKVTTSVFKSLLSGFVQVVWTIVGISILNNQFGDLIISNPEIFNQAIDFVLFNWIPWVLILSLFFLFVNLREIFRGRKR